MDKKNYKYKYKKYKYLYNVLKIEGGVVDTVKKHYLVNFTVNIVCRDCRDISCEKNRAISYPLYSTKKEDEAKEIAEKYNNHPCITKEQPVEIIVHQNSTNDSFVSCSIEKLLNIYKLIFFQINNYIPEINTLNANYFVWCSNTKEGDTVDAYYSISYSTENYEYESIADHVKRVQKLDNKDNGTNKSDVCKVKKKLNK
jgi:hypothetical protein